MEVRVDVAAAGAHHQSFQRCKSHRGINASTVADAPRAAPIPKMCRNELSLVEWLTNQFRRLQRDKMMARTMESIPADSVLLVVFVRNRVVESIVRKSLMKRSIEHHDLRLIREQFASNANALNARRIMKGPEICQFFDPSHDALSNEDGPAKIFTAMNHAMSDGFNIELLLVTQDFDRPQKRVAMIRSRHYLFALKPFEINQVQV